MATYADETLDRIPPMLKPGEKEHVLVTQDECVFHTNEYRRRSWLAQDQQPIRKKGHGRVIHVSDFISETIGRVKLSDEQIVNQLKLPDEQRIPAFEARKITYPGKGFDVTGSWDEDSSYASWTGVSSGTGLVLYGLIGSKGLS